MENEELVKKINNVLKVLGIVVLIYLGWNLINNFTLLQFAWTMVLFALILPKDTVMKIIYKFWITFKSQSEK